jgi:Type VI secretion system (T6SS), amidase immunity protein
MMRVFVATMALLLARAAVPPDSSKPEVPKYSQVELLRNYAMARCLSQAFPGSALEPDATASAAGYLERGSVNADAYIEIAKLADTFLARKYPSQSAQPLQTMKCIDLFQSKDLNLVVKRFAAKR